MTSCRTTFRALTALLFVAIAAACSNEPAPLPPKTAEGAKQTIGSVPMAARAPVGVVPPVQAAPAATKMAPTPGTVVRATELKDKPAAEAKTLKQLAAKSAVTIVDRQGGWLRVTVQGQQGWVRLLHVSTQPAGAGGGKANDLEAAKRIATGRAGGGNIVATSGIRGLNEEQLRTAAANPAELKRLDGYAATEAQASDYARKHGLAPRRVAFPKAPQ